MNTFDRLMTAPARRGGGYLVLIDPDHERTSDLSSYVRSATEAGVDGFLIGGSLMMKNSIETLITTVKKNTNVPVVIFPGSLFQISSAADAILFLVLISGRNPDHLIGNQVLAAPVIRSMGLEAISTGYMLINTGRTTSAEFMSNTKSIPQEKTDIAVAHAIAAESIGMKVLYLDAGSGADGPIPDAMIGGIRKHCALPMIIGGGIRSPEEARRKIEAGASFIVTGTANENNTSTDLVRDFAEAIHAARPKSS